MNEVIQSMEGNDTYDTWQQGFLSIFEYVLENKEFVKIHIILLVEISFKIYL